MGRIYARREEEIMNVFFVGLECDHCDAFIKPFSEISKSGWMKTGTYREPGRDNSYCGYWCPDCWSKRDE